MQLRWRMSTCATSRTARGPPLAQCTEQEFEEDLYTFLTHRGEVELANDLRNKRINW